MTPLAELQSPSLRDRFNDWRGRLPKQFDGLPFIYIGEEGEHHIIGFWTGEKVVEFMACDDEVFERANDPR